MHVAAKKGGTFRKYLPNKTALEKIIYREMSFATQPQTYFR